MQPVPDITFENPFSPVVARVHSAGAARRALFALSTP
jgi:hypothetical protein